MKSSIILPESRKRLDKKKEEYRVSGKYEVFSEKFKRHELKNWIQRLDHEGYENWYETGDVIVADYQGRKQNLSNSFLEIDINKELEGEDSLELELLVPE